MDKANQHTIESHSIRVPVFVVNEIHQPIAGINFQFNQAKGGETRNPEISAPVLLLSMDVSNAMMF